MLERNSWEGRREDREEWSETTEILIFHCKLARLFHHSEGSQGSSLLTTVTMKWDTQEHNSGVMLHEFKSWLYSLAVTLLLLLMGQVS